MTLSFNPKKLKKQHKIPIDNPDQNILKQIRGYMLDAPLASVNNVFCVCRLTQYC